MPAGKKGSRGRARGKGNGRDERGMGKWSKAVVTSWGEITVGCGLGKKNRVLATAGSTHASVRWLHARGWLHAHGEMGCAQAAQGGSGVGREGKGRGLGLFISFLCIYFLFSLSFVSIPYDLILSSSTSSQMRRIHNKQNRQSIVIVA
jgi:hypothetical protein